MMVVGCCSGLAGERRHYTTAVGGGGTGIRTQEQLLRGTAAAAPNEGAQHETKSDGCMSDGSSEMAFKRR